MFRGYRLSQPSIVGGGIKYSSRPGGGTIKTKMPRKHTHKLPRAGPVMHAVSYASAKPNGDAGVFYVHEHTERKVRFSG